MSILELLIWPGRTAEEAFDGRIRVHDRTPVPARLMGGLQETQPPDKNWSVASGIDKGKLLKELLFAAREI